MKTRLLILTVICLMMASFFVYPTKATANNGLVTFSKKTNSPFSFVRTHRQGKGITATWGMQVSDNVIDFRIERTYEDPADPNAYWEELTVVLCDGSRSYSHTDNNVSPGFINYRIIANLVDGTTVTSEISSVRIVSRK
ncbi:MAG TPA: hypothetical protein VEB40_12415 [Flavipsychrobacter sp.]|nr:hypothetical protein [Flavipsychrobacter sp.]